tara:strand:- start:92 stop:238 length:147 start_codon:yes stop_codon:yes gene_type:complete
MNDTSKNGTASTKNKKKQKKTEWITVKKTYLEKKIKANPHKDTIKIKA